MSENEQITTNERTPQLEDGWIRIASEIFENLSKTDISGQAYRIIFVIWRQTYGWGRREAIITLDMFAERTGLPKCRILKVSKYLQSRNIIKRQKGRFGTLYEFNKNSKQWTLEKPKAPMQKIVKNDNAGETKKEDLKGVEEQSKDLTPIVKNDNSIVKNDNSIVKNDNGFSTSYNATSEDKIIYKNTDVIHNQNEEKSENSASIIDKSKDIVLLSNDNNTLKSTENVKKDNSKTDELFDLNGTGKTPKEEPKKEPRSLLTSPNAAHRLCGLWDQLYKKQLGQAYLRSFAKEVMNYNRLLNKYSEKYIGELMQIFFEFTADENQKWFYKKTSFNVFYDGVSSLVAEHSARQKKQPNNPTLMDGKSINSRRENEKQTQQKKTFQTVNFDIMISDLKKQYGKIDAFAHIPEYERDWKYNLKILIQTLKGVIVHETPSNKV